MIKSKAFYRRRDYREIKLFRKEFKDKITSFFNSDLKYGYVVASCGAGKTFTTFISICDTYKPSEVVFVTSKHSIFINILTSKSNRDVILSQKFGKEWLDMYSPDTVNSINQPYFIYDTITSMHSKCQLIPFLSEKKLLFFDESTYSGSSQFKGVSLDIKNTLKNLKIIGCSLFDYRPMDDFDIDFMRNFYENCICSYSVEELQSRGVLPVVKVLKAYQSSESLYEVKKNDINPRTGKKFTLNDCRRLIKIHGLSTVNNKSFSDRLFKIFKREGWLNIKSFDKCIHIMVVSSLVKVMEANTEYLVAFLKDTFDLSDDEIKVFYLASTKDYKKDNDVSLRSFNDKSPSNVKIKILSGVNMLNEGLHTEPEIDILVNLNDSKAEYTTVQKCGRLLSQSFTHQPYFIDVACDSDLYEVMFGQPKFRSTYDEFKDIEPYESITGLSADIFDLDDIDDLSGCNYISQEEEYKLIDFVKRNVGLLSSTSDIIYRACAEFNYISDVTIKHKLLDLGIVDI